MRAKRKKTSELAEPSGVNRSQGNPSVLLRLRDGERHAGRGHGYWRRDSVPGMIREPTLRTGEPTGRR